ncbi:MAG: choice-of-anchor D domain-containing protein [Terracidiphilus sp.]
MRHLKLSFIVLLTVICSIALSGCGGSLAATNAATGTLITSLSTVDFGQVAVGKTVSTDITLTNSGSAAVEISALNLTGQPFSMSGGSSLPMAVGANASVTLTIKFDPTGSGSATGQLAIASNASNASSATVSLSGMGVPMLTGLNCVNGSVTGASSDACTVTLNATAASGGLDVALASSDSAVAIPASVTVPAGASSVDFTASVSPVTTVQAATLTASVGGVAETFSVQLNAALAVLGISASSVPFGSVPVNSAVTEPLVLSSTGTIPVTVSAASLSGTGFSISGGGLPVTLAPGQTTTLSVQFDPTAAGAESGQLSLTSNSSGGGSTVIVLSGTGVPVLSALNCTSGAIAGAGTDSCTATLNTAAASGGFVVSLSSSNSLATVPASVTVAAGSISANFTVNVSPVNSAETAILTASAGSVSEIFTLDLNASSPILSLSTSSIDFGDAVTNIPATETLTLTSTGTSAVTVSAASLTGTGFADSGATFPLTLNPNQAATVTLQFDPAATGSTTGELDLTSNSSDGNFKRIGLRGRGVPRLTQLSCTNTTITGAGTDNCTVTTSTAVPSGGLNVNLTSNNPSFVVPASMTLAAGSTSGNFSATVSAVNVAQAVTVSANATGFSAFAGVQLEAASISLGVSSSSLSFGNVNVNTATSQTVTLSSTGTSAVTVSAASVAGTGFMVSGATFPLTLNPNQTATLTVQFDPTTAGAATAQLTLTSNSSSGTSTLINLSGTGMPALTALSCASGSITEAGSDSCTVTLNTAAAGGFTVSLASNDSAVTVPASVTVGAGATTANFTATVSAVSTAQTATLTASANGVAQTFGVQLNGGVPTLSGLSCSNGSFTGAGTDSCTVTLSAAAASLSAAAASGGLIVSLASNNTAVTLPASVTVAAGATTASFTATVTSVSTAQAVTLTASANSVVETFALQLGSSVPTLTVSAGSIAFGTVNVNTPTTQTLTLSSTGTAAVNVSAATVAGSGYTISGVTFPLTLNPNQTATLTVQFDPTIAGAANGSLTLTSNSSSGTSMLISLSGTGVPVLSGLSCTSGSFTGAGTCRPQ